MIFKILASLFLLISIAGCVTTDNSYDQNKTVQQFYNQQRTYEPFVIKGAQEISFKAPEGKTIEMKVTNPLDPLNQYQPPKSTAQSVIEGTADVAKYGVIGLATYKTLDSISNK